MVDETIAETGERWGVVARIARQLGIGEQTLRNWVRLGLPRFDGQVDYAA